MEYPWTMCIQSWCFRDNKDNAAVAEAIKACDVCAVELSGAHVDFRNPASFAGVIAAYRDRGILLPSVGVCHFSGEEEKDRVYLDFARQAGARAVSFTFSFRSYPQVLHSAERLAEEYGINLAIHNHGATDWLGTSGVLSHIFATTSHRIGLCLDTAWAIDSGEDPVVLAQRCADRLRTVHLKDFVYDRSGKPEDVIPGDGCLDLPSFVKTLLKAGCAGNLVIEYEGDRHDPLPSLQKCVARVRSTLAGL